MWFYLSGNWDMEATVREASRRDQKNERETPSVSQWNS